ncbi:MAG: hypothetical protein IKV96_05095 [Firmicutes bacterium]|nr:hypothetical protein [Bacillota bacterium]
MKNIKEIFGGDKKSAKLAKQAVALLMILVFTLILANVLLTDSDGRNSIISEEGSNTYKTSEKTGDEIRLENILAAMAGVGDVKVMIKGSDDESSSLFTEEEPGASDVDGVIVVADGAANAVIKSEIVEAVATVCNISPTDVIVFEMTDDLNNSGAD